MNSTTFRMPARGRRAQARSRRCGAAAAAVALAAAPSAIAAPAAHATGGEGRASAVVLRTELDVSLLDKGARIPLEATLNEVTAPATAERTALTVRLDGVHQGGTVRLLRADAATARATSDAHRAEGYARLAKAKVHVPGLPLLSLIEVENVTSRAVCVAGERPVAEANLLGRVTVLGKRVTLTADGPTVVGVPGVGTVTVDLSRTRTTSRTAAATALELKVAVDPLKLNVAAVQGTVTLAGATCEAPAPTASAPGGGSPEPGATPGTSGTTGSTGATGTSGAAGGPDARTGGESPVREAAATETLAETGGGSRTPYIAGAAVALLAAGGASLALTRRKARARN
ncbi:SCO1860 family LAETG-anchored protein [Streptomyces sp. NPDC047928]|uniref:SCO1860 family LAETG-anchored protein n=1 Tax=unclassified Streptomyces TaxID=2593676 RepID=UPI003713B98F